MASRTSHPELVEGSASSRLSQLVKNYVVYILSNSAAVLYLGVTSDLSRRLAQHQDGTFPDSFASRYNLNRLVYVETFPTARQAIAREKQLKKWSRLKKLALIKIQNPDWRDLAHS